MDTGTQPAGQMRRRREELPGAVLEEAAACWAAAAVVLRVVLVWPLVLEGGTQAWEGAPRVWEGAHLLCVIEWRKGVERGRRNR